MPICFMNLCLNSSVLKTSFSDQFLIIAHLVWWVGRCIFIPHITDIVKGWRINYMRWAKATIQLMVVLLDLVQRPGSCRSEEGSRGGGSSAGSAEKEGNGSACKFRMLVFWWHPCVSTFSVLYWATTRWCYRLVFLN